MIQSLNKNRSCRYFILINCFLFSVCVIGLGCTKDDASESQKAQSVNMPIKMPMPPPPPPVPVKTTEEKVEEDENPTAPSQISSPVEEKQVPENEVFYIVRKDDTLFKIAERSDVYNNPLKWTYLLCMNLEKFDGMQMGQDFQHKALPEGLALRYVPLPKKETTTLEHVEKVYAVNVLSAENSKKIVPPAIRLIRKGFNVYLCKAVVDEKEWIRLRVGFYDSYAKAVEAREQIAAILEGTSVWVVRISRNEIKEYGGMSCNPVKIGS